MTYSWLENCALMLPMLNRIIFFCSSALGIIICWGICIILGFGTGGASGCYVLLGDAAYSSSLFGTIESLLLLPLDCADSSTFYCTIYAYRFLLDFS